MNRCHYCNRFIFPWQRRGWFVRLDGTRMWWHSACGWLHAFDEGYPYELVRTGPDWPVDHAEGKE